MRDPETYDGIDDKVGALRASLILFAFGLLVLGYLAVIGRAEWFVLRPASGASVAMSAASGIAAQHDGEESATKRHDPASARNAL